MKKAFVQKMAPEIGKKSAKELFNSIWESIKEEENKKIKWIKDYEI